MFCHKCGGTVPNTARFCHHCGVKLHTLPPPAPMPASAPSAQPAKRKRAGVKWYIALPAVLCVCALLAGWLLLSGSVEDKVDSVMYLELYDEDWEFVGSGSGFYMEDGKTLVTNYHVIEDIYHIRVYPAVGDTYTEVSAVLACDRRADLAILQCKSDLGIKPLKLGDSDRVKTGDSVYAVGYPLGLANTLSDGIVSARYYDEGVDTLQITAAVSGGSSGGALLNERGQVVGVICAYYEDGQNLNLAIASNEVRDLYESRGSARTLAQLNG